MLRVLQKEGELKMQNVMSVILFTAWLLCGCCVETVVDHPSAGIVFLIALVVCIVVAIFMDRADL